MTTYEMLTLQNKLLDLCREKNINIYVTKQRYYLYAGENEDCTDTGYVLVFNNQTYHSLSINIISTLSPLNLPFKYGELDPEDPNMNIAYISDPKYSFLEGTGYPE